MSTSTKTLLPGKATSNIPILLDTVISKLHTGAVPDRFDIAESMRQRLQHECKRLASVRNEMKAVAEAYNRFVDLCEEQLKRENRIKRIIGVLGPTEHIRMIKEETEPDSTLSSAITATARDLRDDLPLWEAMKEYLQHVPEARIAEMEEFFSSAEMPNANRQSMESALRRHSDTFRVRKDKRHKYISLRKQAQEGE